MNKLLKQALIVSTLLLPTVSSAYELNDKVLVNTYISQGMLYTPDNPFSGMEDISFAVRGIGINGNYQYSDVLRFSGHILAKQAGEASDGEPSLHFLLADYTMHSSNNIEFGVRIGRIQNQFGIYNATRYVPNSQPGIKVPQSVYFDTSFKELMMSTDGVNLYLNTVTDMGVFDLNVYAGERAVVGDAFEYFVFKRQTPGDFKRTDTLGLKLDFSPSSQPNLQLAYSALNLRSSLEDTKDFSAQEIADAKLAIQADPRSAREFITNFDTDILLQLVSLQYGFDNWLFTTEYAWVNTKQSNIAVLYDDKHSHEYNSEGYYFQLEYLGWEKVTLFTRLDYQYLDKGTTEELKINPAGRFPNELFSYGESATIGFRWYILPDLTLSAQLSENRGVSCLPKTEDLTPNDYKENWTWAAMRLTYEF